MMENALVVLHAQFLGSSPAPCGQKHSAVQGCRSEWLLFSLAVWVLQYRQLVVQVLGWAQHSELCICTDPQHCKWGLRGRSSGFCVSFWCILRFCCPFSASVLLLYDFVVVLLASLENGGAQAPDLGLGGLYGWVYALQCCSSPTVEAAFSDSNYLDFLYIHEMIAVQN